MKCRERLEQYFRENKVSFEAMTHPQVYTAQEVAAAQHVPGKQLAKVVMVMADEEKMAMMVLPASYRLDFGKVREVLGAKKVRLARESEFAELFPDCEVGAMPPFGHFYNVPTYVDVSLTDNPHIVFRAGTHRESIKISYADYARLAKPTVAEFAIHL